MKTPLLLAFISAAVSAAAGYGQLPEGLLPIGLCALTAAGLLALWEARRVSPPAKPRRARRDLAIDGSNLLYWRGETPDLATVAKILRQLETQGRRPHIWFDANVGYLVAARYLNAAELASMLKIDREDVTVAAKGEPADPLILAAAQRQGLQVLSNDRYRDWHEAFPFITEEGRLLRGKLQDGALRLEPAFAPKSQARSPKPSAFSIAGERRPTSAPRQRNAAQTPRRKEPRF